jgi:hypothetical protein
LVIATGFLYLYRDLFEAIARYALKRAYVESGDANVSIIWPSHFAHTGRSIEVRMGSSEISLFGMMLTIAFKRERDVLSHEYVDANGGGPT